MLDNKPTSHSCIAVRIVLPANMVLCMMPPMCLQRMVNQSTEIYEKVIHLNIIENDLIF